MQTMTTLTAMIFTLAMLAPAGAMARPNVTIGMQAETEIVVEEQGKQVRKRVPAETVEPGAMLIYTLTYNNDGDEKATGVVLDNPMPENTAYITDTAWGDGAEISFSIDGGKSFKQPSMLTYEQVLPDGRTEKQVATPEQYTHIRWRIEEIPAGSSGNTGFRVIVK